MKIYPLILSDQFQLAQPYAQIKKYLLSVSACLFLGANIINVHAADIDSVTGVGEQRVTEGAKAQSEVDKLSEQTRDLLAQYLGLTKTVDGLVLYNNLLGQQVATQDREIEELKNSIDNVAVMERQIIPLAQRMIDGLKEFVQLDVPFLLEERTKRIEKLEAMMPRPDVSVAEKVRKVFEAYQIETSYSRNIESYQGQLELEGVKREVDFLRVGRVALVYRTLDGEQLGRWDGEDWQALNPADYKRYVEKGLKIAAKQEAPNLITVPVTVPAEAK